MHRTPRAPSRRGLQIVRQVGLAADGRAYLAFARHAQGGCAGRKAGRTALLEPPLGGGAGEQHPRALAQSGRRPLCAGS